VSFDTVDLLTGNLFQVSWDLGRRCNYDCTYCPTTRHDNFSPHATLEQLKSNVDFLFEYMDTYMQYRDFKEASISFTGGEPTVNPNFIPFIEYLKEEYNKRYRDKWHTGFSLTSNGAMGPKIAKAIIDKMSFITLSYHAEADEKLKKQIKERIKQFQQASEDAKNSNGQKYFGFKVNVMFHAQHFDECKELCKWLDKLGVWYVPRIIGEEPDSLPSFAHKYTEDQLDYIKNYWRYKEEGLNNDKLSAVGEKTTEKKKLGMVVGRPCCGGREMCLSSGGTSKKSTFVNMREFKGWHCSVNWFFLHLEQQTDQVFHHQTCQARFDGTRGPIGKISEGHKIITQLKQKLASKTMPTMICPKHTCGCGLCAPKSKFKEKYLDTVATHFDTGVLNV
tara:strand:+ start:7389 stop:8561 length:1173 start_codon:yes stop_codon:yes gene_type:complete